MRTLTISDPPLLASAASGRLIDRLRGGTQSPELFTVSGAVNEFDIMKLGTDWYWWHTSGTNTLHRSASSVAGLSSASSSTAISSYRYAHVARVGSDWVFFASPGANGNGCRFVGAAVSPSGPTDIGHAWYDQSPTQRPSDGKWLLAYKASSRVGVAVADTIDGTWTDLGEAFSAVPRSWWHSDEEADPHIVVDGSEAFLLFSAYDGSKQRIAIAPFDMATGKVTAQGVVLVSPDLSWQQRNSSNKVFSPRWREGLLFFSHNPSDTGVTSGWATVTPGLPPADGRTDLGVVRVDASWRDVQSGLPGNVHGSASVSSGDLVMTAGTQAGCYGRVNATTIPADFEIDVSFTPTSLPGSGTYVIVGGIKKANLNPVCSIWLTNSKPYFEMRNAANTSSLTATVSSTLTTGVRTRLQLRRVGTTVTMLRDGVSVYSGTHSGGALVGLRDWIVGNQLTDTTFAQQQFTGTVHSFSVTRL